MKMSCASHVTEITQNRNCTSKALKEFQVMMFRLNTKKKTKTILTLEWDYIKFCKHFEDSICYFDAINWRLITHDTFVIIIIIEEINWNDSHAKFDPFTYSNMCVSSFCNRIWQCVRVWEGERERQLFVSIFSFSWQRMMKRSINSDENPYLICNSWIRPLHFDSDVKISIHCTILPRKSMISSWKTTKLCIFTTSWKWATPHPSHS